MIQGATGSGKTYLACAIAHQDCRQGLSTLYVRAPRLFEEFNLCHADGSFRKRLAAIAKTSVLIIDDFAIAPIGPRERNDLLEFIDDRVSTRACIVTSQLPVSDWHDYIGDPTLAAEDRQCLVGSLVGHRRVYKLYYSKNECITPEMWWPLGPSIHRFLRLVRVTGRSCLSARIT